MLTNDRPAMKLVVFDVCGTLYHANTTFEFLDYYFEGNPGFSLFRRFSKSFFAKLVNYPFRRFAHYDLLRACTIAFLRGEDVEVVNKSAKYFVQEQLEAKINHSVAALCDGFREQGYYIVLMSGSLDIIVEEVASRFKVDAFFASSLLAKKEILVGVYGEDKLFNKRETLTRRYPDIDELVVVTDNLTDLDLVKHADKAYIVCNKRKHKKFWQAQHIARLEFVE